MQWMSHWYLSRNETFSWSQMMTNVRLGFTCSASNARRRISLLTNDFFLKKIRVSFASDDREFKKGRSLQRKHHFKILLSGRFTVLRHGHVSHADTCRRLADYVNKLHQGASRTCSTIIFPHSTNQIIREFKQPQRLRQMQPHLKINICAMVTIFRLFLFCSLSKSVEKLR